MKTVNLSADSRKRISLNKLLPDLPISILEPMVEIPAREAWLHQNESRLICKIYRGRIYCYYPTTLGVSISL